MIHKIAASRSRAAASLLAALTLACACLVSAGAQSPARAADSLSVKERVEVFEKAGEKGGRLYSNPVVLLVNEGTGSTSELIVNALQERGRAYVVGARSCGCVLGVLEHRELKGGGGLDVSELGFVTPKGRRLEGEGVSPDKAVTVTLGDIQGGRDLALEAAEDYLKSLRGAAK